MSWEGSLPEVCRPTTCPGRGRQCLSSNQMEARIPIYIRRPVSTYSIRL